MLTALSSGWVYGSDPLSPGAGASSASGSLERKKCDHCNAEMSQLMRCSDCKAAWYCSKNCQVAEWPEHQKKCRETMKLTSNQEVKSNDERITAVIDDCCKPFPENRKQAAQEVWERLERIAEVVPPENYQEKTQKFLRNLPPFLGEFSIPLGYECISVSNVEKRLFDALQEKCFHPLYCEVLRFVHIHMKVYLESLKNPTRTSGLGDSEAPSLADRSDENGSGSNRRDKVPEKKEQPQGAETRQTSQKQIPQMSEGEGAYEKSPQKSEAAIPAVGQHENGAFAFIKKLGKWYLAYCAVVIAVGIPTCYVLVKTGVLKLGDKKKTGTAS